MRARLGAVLGLIAAIALVSCGAPSTPDFVKKAAKGNLYQVQAGQLASEKGQSDAVKQLARAMVEARGKIGDELKAIVQAEKLAVEMPEALDGRQLKWIETLKATKPESFDRIYAQQQVKALGRATELFDRYAELGDNASLKQFAANTLVTLKQHLEQAKQLPQ
jgi:putative membrane protein